MKKKPVVKSSKKSTPEIQILKSWPTEIPSGRHVLIEVLNPTKSKTAITTFQSIVVNNNLIHNQTLNGLYSDFESNLGPARTGLFSIALSATVDLRVLALSDKASTFEIHETFRRDLGQVFDRSVERELWIDFSRLRTDFQRQAIETVASLARLQSWKPETFGKRAVKKSEQKPLRIYVKSDLKPKDIDPLIAKSQLIAEGTNHVRTLADLPTNKLTPELYIKHVETRAAALGYNTKFHSEKDLENLGAGAFLAVSAGAKGRKNGILEVSWTPKKGKGRQGPKITFVGKGLCFDTGGYNVKTGSYMHGMHRDMTGSAVALAAFETLVQLGVKAELKAYLALAENLISTEAFKPNDVVVALDGTSIEIVDTDAEGRLVLADTLALASKEKPDVIIDFATLTGAAHRAIGTKRACVFSNKSTLARSAVEVGAKAGERLWTFPIGEDYRDALKSDYADILQCIAAPGPDHILASTFLSHFVGETPWLHVDLSSDSNKGGLGLVSTETTGFGVRWAVEFSLTQMFGKVRA